MTPLSFALNETLPNGVVLTFAKLRQFSIDPDTKQGSCSYDCYLNESVYLSGGAPYGSRVLHLDFTPIANGALIPAVLNLVISAVSA